MQGKAHGSVSRNDLLVLVKELLAPKLRMAPTALPDHTPFARLGVDSLMAVELVRALATRLEVRLHATLLFEVTTVAALADYLAQKIRPRGGGPHDAGSPGFGDGGQA